MSQANSPRWAITTRVVCALESAIQGLPVVRNPRHPTALAEGTQVLFVKEQSDKLLEAQGGTEKRQLTIAVGVVSREPDADSDADVLHQRLGKVMRALAVAPGTGIAAMPWRTMAEQDVRFSVEGLDVDGALIVSIWEFTYLRKRDQETRK